MKEKNIKIIMSGLVQRYGYILEDIKSVDRNSELWTVSKNINGDDQRLIFMTEQRLQELMQYDIPEDKNNVYILFYEDGINENKEEGSPSVNKILDKPTIRVGLKEKKVEYTPNVNMQVVNDLAAVMSNNNLHIASEKISLKDKPLITMGLIVINIIMYVITAYMTSVYAGGSIFSSDTRVLILLGAKVNELIAGGQYFRLVSSMFLHGGLMHLAINMYSLYAIGPMIERVYGKKKYLVIYFLSGICSSIFSYLFSPSVSIGASGAIFGLLGAVLVFAIKSKGKTGTGFIKSILSVIFINVIIGITLPNIDNFAHMGGLIGGVIISFLVSFKSEYN
ncbi:rhomboid family intramembrane serine protease [Clostridium sp.]|uniref:rhomboid family intramembrane serine protease n=1 Tax=Clostridium sp. TaxID=1506 RepID=UPI003D6CC0B7